jgi:uncharacterized protein (DUF1778 family)
MCRQTKKEKSIMESTTTAPKQTKDSQLHIRATTAELQEWQQAAEAMGFKTLTGFVRAAIVNFTPSSH